MGILPDCPEKASTDAVFSSTSAKQWFENCSLGDFFRDKLTERLKRN